MLKALGILALVAFAGGALLSLAFLGMAVHEGPGMPGCPLMPAQAVICTMTAMDHIAAWQAMFTGLPQIASLALLALLAAYLLRPLALAYAPPQTAQPARLVRESSLLSSPLEQLFSRGILHPKLY
jgi:hypothetical protein